MSFVPAFYINLDSRPDRREHIEAQLKRIGLPAERVRALTPADLPAERIEAASNALSLTELACSMSHQQVWQIIIDRNLDGALVLEDDAVLSSRLSEVMKISDLHLRLDALQLESLNSSPLIGRPHPLIAGVNMHRLMSASLGACAYYLTKGHAIRLLNRKDLDAFGVDSLLFGRYSRQLYMSRTFQSVPALAAQLVTLDASDTSVGRSDLEMARNSRTSTAGSAPGRLVRLTNNLQHVGLVLGAFGQEENLFRATQRRLPIASDIIERP
jgi:glycosyl transferase family 25